MIARVKVLASYDATPTAHVVHLEKPAGFTFAPVQFCGLEIMTAEGSEEYPMSLACSPTRPHLEFGARITGTPWKQAFRALRPGDQVEVDGAYGHFLLDPARPAVLVAGGIGITPLKGMAEYAADTGMPHAVTLVYSSRSEEEIVYRDELDALERQNPRFRVLHTLTREPPDSAWNGRRGRVGEALLREAALEGAVWYVCGAPSMVADALTTLHRMGVPPERLRSEKFSGYR